MSASRVAGVLAGWLVTLVVMAAVLGCIQYGWSWLGVIAVVLVGNTFAFAFFWAFVWMWWCCLR
jgi:hypothetical protein